LPKKCFATRIENKHGGGVPDVHMVWDHRPFWMELKVAKSNAVKVSPHQVAWNMAYWARGGVNFFLVKAPSHKCIYLFEGDQGPRLVGAGLSGLEPVGSGVGSVGSGSGLQGSRFDNVQDLYLYLDKYLNEKYGRGPKAPKLSVVQ